MKRLATFLVAIVVVCPGAMAAEAPARMTAGDFEADWKSLLGKTVTLTACRIEADTSVVVCSSDTSRIVLDRATMNREDLRLTLRVCKVGNDATACIADVTGIANALTEDVPQLKKASFKKE